MYLNNCLSVRFTLFLYYRNKVNLADRQLFRRIQMQNYKIIYEKLPMRLIFVSNNDFYDRPAVVCGFQ